MNEEKLKLVVQNALATEDGYQFVKYLIEQSGYFDETISFEPNKEYFIRGKKKYGSFILSLVKRYNFKNFIRIHEERED